MIRFSDASTVTSIVQIFRQFVTYCLSESNCIALIVCARVCVCVCMYYDAIRQKHTVHRFICHIIYLFSSASFCFGQFPFPAFSQFKPKEHFSPMSVSCEKKKKRKKTNSTCMRARWFCSAVQQTYVYNEWWIAKWRVKRIWQFSVCMRWHIFFLIYLCVEHSAYIVYALNNIIGLSNRLLRARNWKTLSVNEILNTRYNAAKNSDAVIAFECSTQAAQLACRSESLCVQFSLIVRFQVAVRRVCRFKNILRFCKLCVRIRMCECVRAERFFGRSVCLSLRTEMCTDNLHT